MADAAMTYYHPFDAGNGANVTEEGWRRMARFWQPSGVMGGYANELRPFGDSTGLQAKVDTGAAWVRGHYGELTGSVTMPLAAVGGIAGGQERWDRLILRSDFGNNVVQVGVLTGTAGASPNSSRPALTQSSSVWEELLADVGPLVNTTTTITAAMVIDGRWRMTPSGILYYENVLAAAAASVKLPAAGTIPTGSGYRDLELMWEARGDAALAAVNLNAQVNGDTGGNYDSQWLKGLAATLSSGEIIAGTTAFFGTFTAASGTPANQPGSGKTTIPNYAGTTFRKSFMSLFGFKTADGTANVATQTAWGGWRNTAAITTMLLSPSSNNFATGSNFRLSLRP